MPRADRAKRPAKKELPVNLVLNLWQYGCTASPIANVLGLYSAKVVTKIVDQARKMRDPRAVLSRDAAIEAIWGGAGTDNLVDRYVARVRHKLGDPETIRTVRGVGFILAP